MPKPHIPKLSNGHATTTETQYSYAAVWGVLKPITKAFQLINFVLSARHQALFFAAVTLTNGWTCAPSKAIGTSTPSFNISRIVAARVCG